MRKRNIGLVAVVVGLLCLFAGAVLAVDGPAPWLSASNPSLEKVVDLPDNIPPSSSNWDCDKIITKYSGTSAMHDDCVVQTPLGVASGNGIIFNGSSEQMSFQPPDGYFGLQPIPGQSLFYGFSSAPISGLYIHFYRSIWDKIDPVPHIIDGRWQYKMTKGPDITLKDAAGKPLSLNSSSIAFSPNGSWMVADVRYWGFIRVNMATFEITPFTYSMNQGSDPSSYSAFLSISNDGRYVALKPGNEQAFRVFDLTGCKYVSWPVANVGCPNRDYWLYLSSQLPGFRAMYLPRFSGENQLSLSAIYNYSPTQFKVSQFNLTAPGENPKGIEYLGMGDSFSSGQGAFNYVAGTDTESNTCHLSALSYPYLLSANLFSVGHSVACSGAKTKDITGISESYTGQNFPKQTKLQLDNAGLLSMIYTDYTPGYLLQNDFVQKYNPQVVTMTIGGNDLGFDEIIKSCVTPSIVNRTCYSSYEDQQELVNRIQNIEPTLRATYRAVMSPGRRAYIIGYPQIVVSGGNCAANVHLDEDEIKLFIGLTDTLNGVLKRAAASAGVQFVDVSDALAGHRMCETQGSEVAVNGFTVGKDDGIWKIKFIGNESYHPNTLGHDLLRSAILLKTNNLKQPMPLSGSLTSAAGSTLPLGNAPKTGRPIFQSVSDASLAPNIVAPLSPTNLHVDPAAAVLLPAATYSVKLDADATTIGTGTTDSNGNFSGSTTIPATTPCGLHAIHVLGKNAANQPLDIVKVVYVASATNDCDGNGSPDAIGPCGMLNPLGVDIDKDGIDDACDGSIGKPPTYSVYLTGSSIHASKAP